MSYQRGTVKAIILACCISCFITPLLSTMMNLSLVNIGAEFNVGSHDLAYVNSAFLLASLIFMVPIAKIGDIIGKKKTFFIGLVVVMAGCILASVSPNFWFVIACRMIIGAGSAALAIEGVSLLVDVVPANRRGAILGIQAMCIYTGLSIGPAVGGLFNDLFGWRVLFITTVPLSLASMLFLHMFKDDIAPAKGSSFDTKSAVVYALAIGLSMLGVMNLPNVIALTSLIMGIILVAVFVKMQIGNRECLLEMKLFRNKVFSGSCVATFMSYAASFSVSFFLALYLQSIGQLTATEAGILMIVQPAIQAVGTPLCGKLCDRIERKYILPTAGMAIIAVGMATFIFYDMNTTLVIVVITMVLAGIGFSLFSAPNTTILMSSVPKEYTGEASGLLSFMRQTGMVVSMGIAMMFISLIMGSMDNLCPETYGQFLEVIRWSFIVCTAMCIIGMGASALRGNTSKDARPLHVYSK